MQIETARNKELDQIITQAATEWPNISNKDLYFYVLINDNIPMSDHGVWEYLDFLKYLSIYYVKHD